MFHVLTYTRLKALHFREHYTMEIDNYFSIYYGQSMVELFQASCHMMYNLYTIFLFCKRLLCEM